jgi:hypothetical protein
VNLEDGLGMARRREHDVALPDARGAAAPHPARLARSRAVKELGLSNAQFQVKVDGDLDPACRFIFRA